MDNETDMAGRYNPEKHNRRSIRLQGYNYTRQGVYFVTICARNRKCIFTTPVGAPLVGALSFTGARIVNAGHTWIGEIINNNWRNIPHEYGNVYIDEYIIMPNHLHGILFFSAGDKSVCANKMAHANRRAPARGAPTALGQVIGSFKSRCVDDCLRYIRDNNLNEIGKIWQRNYYERIIRNESELNRIREYIINNPLHWHDDENNPENL